ncbi:MAG: hypothetical protein AB7Q37_09940 [Pyrinomonadaceae bacterium]
MIIRRIMAVSLSLLLAFVSFAALPTAAYGQDSKVALQRGYRTGYSDGYMAGYRDSLDRAANDFARHGEYERADRAFNSEYGSLDDYRDGYRQGFETGYGAGYGKRSFESKIPDQLGRRGLENTAVNTPQRDAGVPTPESSVSNDVPVQPTVRPIETTDSTYSESDRTAATPITQPSTPAAATSPGSTVKTTFTPVSDAVIIIPAGTELILELHEEISTETAREGDRFTARIISPTEISGAAVEGRITRITRPGRIKRRSEIQLSFNRIILTHDRWSNFDALLVEALPAKGDNVKRVDNEGLAQGDRPYKGDLTKIGAATGTGLTVGAIAGGPVGAAVGAGVGAAFGVGAVVVERGKHINLRKSQQLRVRTSYETQIR